MIKRLFLLLILGLPLTALAQPIQPPALDLGDLEADLEAAMRQNQIEGVVVLVMEGDQVLYLQGLGVNAAGDPMDITAPFSLGRASEPFLALLTLMLGERRLLAPDTPVNVLLPAFNLADRPNATAATTLDRLMTHSAGLGNPPRRPLAPFSSAEIEDIEPQFFAGARFSYCSACTALWVSLIENITQQPLDQTFRDLMFYPLHMDQSGLEDGSIRSTPADLVKFISVHLQAGRWEGLQLVKPETIRLMQRALMPTQYSENDYYGYGWFVRIENGLQVVEPTEDRLLTARDIGDYQAQISLIPAYQRGVVILSDQPTQGLDPLAEIIIEYLSGWSLPEPPTPERAVNLAGSFAAEEAPRSRLELRAADEGETGEGIEVRYGNGDWVRGEWIEARVLAFMADDQRYSLYFTEGGRARTAILWQAGVTQVLNRQE